MRHEPPTGEPDIPAGKIRLEKNPRGFFDWIGFEEL